MQRCRNITNIVVFLEEGLRRSHMSLQQMFPSQHGCKFCSKGAAGRTWEKKKGAKALGASDEQQVCNHVPAHQAGSEREKDLPRSQAGQAACLETSWFSTADVL